MISISLFTACRFVWRKSDDLYESRSDMIFKEVDVNTRRMLRLRHMHLGSKENVESLRGVSNSTARTEQFSLSNMHSKKKPSTRHHDYSIAIFP